MLEGVLALNGLDTHVFNATGDSAPASSGPAEFITVPDAHLLFNGEFQRVGSTGLKITGEDGANFFIENYFGPDKRATLVSPEGAQLTANVVEALAGPLAPGQVAQAGSQTSSGQAVIGRVEVVTGSCTVIRNGVAVTLNVGDTVRKGDVVQTAGGSSVSIVFLDGSTFSLSANARMVLDDFVYSAGGTNNSALISLVQGTFSFVAGQVAKTGDMRVDTPVATMGIRGTAVLVEISANDGQTKFSVMMEPDGTTGSFNLYDKSTGTLIATVNNSTVGWLVTPAGPLQVVAQQIQKTPAELQRELSIVQQIFSIYNQNQQNPFTPDPQERRGDLDDPKVNTQLASNGGGGSSSVYQPPADAAAGGQTPNQPNTIIVTVTPVDSPQPPNVNPGSLPGAGPLASSPPLPLPTGTTGIILGTAGDDILWGTNGNDIIDAGAGNDTVFAEGGDDTVIGGSGEGDDVYYGGAGFDTITFKSANGVLLSLFSADGMSAGTAFSEATGADVFLEFEKIIGSPGNDIFVLNDGFAWEIDAGAGVDTLVLGGNLGSRDFDFGGPVLKNFEIIDLNDGACPANANVVDLDYKQLRDMSSGNSIRIVGGSNDTVNLVDEHPDYPDGHWVLVPTPSGLPFSDGLTPSTEFAVWAYVSDGQTLFTAYVDTDISVNLIENVQVTVDTGNGFDTGSAIYQPFANALAEAYFDSQDGDTVTFYNFFRNLTITLTGTDLDYCYDPYSFEFTGGTITSIEIFDCHGNPLVSATGFRIDAVALEAALAEYASCCDISALEEIFGSATFTILGGDGADALAGSHFNDLLNGGGGDDTLDGSAGNDTLTGGDGADTFIYSGGHDIITDFAPGNDVIDVSHIPDLLNLAQLKAMAVQKGADVVIVFDAHNTLTLKNVTLAQLTEQNVVINHPPELAFCTPSELVEKGYEVAGTDISSTVISARDGEGDAVSFVTTGWMPAPAYEFISAPNISWAEARAAALDLGGYLANITSAEENALVHSIKGANVAWIGASDAGSEGVWTWADGPEAGQTFWTGDGGGTAVLYANWWGSEPNGGTGENYAFIDQNGVWTDVAANEAVHGYIVEYVTYRKTGTYGVATFNPATGELTYKLDNDDPDTQALAAGQTATDSFEITFTDARGAVTTETVTFTIEGSNDRPTLANPLEGITVHPSGEIHFTIPANTFADVDSPTLTYKAWPVNGGALPGWLTFDPATGTFTGTAPATHTVLDIKVVAYDEEELVAFDYFTLTVEEPPVATLTVQTGSGATIVDELALLVDAELAAGESPISETHINLVHPGTGDVPSTYFTVIAEGLTWTFSQQYDLILTGGTITGVEIYRTTNGYEPILEISGLSLPAVDLQAAINAPEPSVFLSLLQSSHAYVQTGGTGHDVLVGGIHNDILTGGGGDDVLVGSAGSDAFVFNPGDGNDWIVDFDTTPSGDLIRLNGFEDIDDFSALQLMMEDAPSYGTVIHLGPDQSITLLGVQKEFLSSSHFVFQMPA